jgi:hypothetical protein
MLSDGIWTVDHRDERAFSPTELIWLVEKGDIIFPDASPEKKIKLCFSRRGFCESTTITLITDRHDIVPRRWEQLSGNGKQQSFKVSTCPIKHPAFDH